MPKRDEAYMQARRREILAAATECIAANGWSATTIEDIAKTAGLSAGAIYIHFDSKGALLEGLLKEHLQDLQNIGAQGAGDFRAWLDGMRDLGGGAGARVARQVMEANIEAARDPEMSALMRDTVGQALSALQGVLRRLRPDLPSEDLRPATLLLVLTTEGARAFQASYGLLSVEDLGSVEDYLLRALGLSPPASG